MIVEEALMADSPDAEPGDTIVKTFDDGSMLVDTKGGQRRRVKFVGTVEMAERIRELDAETEWLKVLAYKIYPDGKKSGICSKTHDDPSCPACFPNWRTLAGQHCDLKQEACNEVDKLKSQLAARDADLRELRAYLATKEHDFSKRNMIFPMVAIGNVIKQLNELPTMKDVK